MSAIFFSNDLMFSSRIEAAGRAVDAVVVTVSAMDALLEAVAAEGTRLVVLDLSTPKLDVGKLVPKLREANQAVRIVAFGPHVHEATLQAASSAGCDQVLTKGQFNSQMDPLLEEHA